MSAELLTAAEAGDLARISSLLDAGEDASGETAEGWTALIRATVNGHAAAVSLLLARGARVNPTRLCHTPLRAAALYGRDDVAALLLEARAEPNLPSQGLRTPLMGCAFARTDDAERYSRAGTLALARRLLRARADPDAQNEAGETAALLAAVRGDEEMLSLLLAAGASADIADLGNRTARALAPAPCAAHPLCAPAADAGAGDEGAVRMRHVYCATPLGALGVRVYTREHPAASPAPAVLALHGQRDADAVRWEWLPHGRRWLCAARRAPACVLLPNLHSNARSAPGRVRTEDDGALDAVCDALRAVLEQLVPAAPAPSLGRGGADTAAVAAADTAAAVVVCGKSWGGALALAFGARHPGACARLLLACPSPELSSLPDKAAHALGGARRALLIWADDDATVPAAEAVPLWLAALSAPAAGGGARFELRRTREGGHSLGMLHSDDALRAAVDAFVLDADD